LKIAGWSEVSDEVGPTIKGCTGAIWAIATNQGG